MIYIRRLSDFVILAKARIHLPKQLDPGPKLAPYAIRGPNDKRHNKSRVKRGFLSPNASDSYRMNCLNPCTFGASYTVTTAACPGIEIPGCTSISLSPPGYLSPSKYNKSNLLTTSNRGDIL